ncbi:MAG: glycosyltransferase, partial [Proteobacteria bacterium]|nr:glycosyltransferase [Pseudomonadota bacterium]
MASFFWLYRPTAPSARAQSIQVIHTAHAMAARGHDVTLCVEALASEAPGEILDFYGLDELPTFHLKVSRRGRTAASLAFRAQFLRWVRRTKGRGVVVARSKRYALEAARILGKRFRLIIEAHEVDSLLAIEGGADPTEFRRQEAQVFALADGVVANCEGTLELIQESYPLACPSVVLHNGTHNTWTSRSTPGPRGTADSPGDGVGYVGSVRQQKDLGTLAAAAVKLDLPVTVVGVDEGSLGPLIKASAGHLSVEPPIPYKDVPDRLARFRVLVLPLSPGLFGEKLTSPIKLWDYMASGVPIVAADLPSL